VKQAFFLCHLAVTAVVGSALWVVSCGGGGDDTARSTTVNRGPDAGLDACGGSCALPGGAVDASAAEAGVPICADGDLPDRCDDGNPCTSDECKGSTCVHTQLPDGSSCDDGQLCTSLDRCLAGQCSGTPRSSAPSVLGTAYAFGGADVGADSDMSWSRVAFLSPNRLVFADRFGSSSTVLSVVDALGDTLTVVGHTVTDSTLTAQAPNGWVWQPLPLLHLVPLPGGRLALVGSRSAAADAWTPVADRIVTSGTLAVLGPWRRVVDVDATATTPTCLTGPGHGEIVGLEATGSQSAATFSPYSVEMLELSSGVRFSGGGMVLPSNAQRLQVVLPNPMVPLSSFVPTPIAEQQRVETDTLTVLRPSAAAGLDVAGTFDLGGGRPSSCVKVTASTKSRRLAALTTAFAFTRLARR